jgi:hypothetical protein
MKYIDRQTDFINKVKHFKRARIIKYINNRKPSGTRIQFG